MDDSELWVPLVQPRDDDDDEELFLPFGPPEEASSHVSSEVWLASASDSLAPASQIAGDTCDDAPFPTRCLLHTRIEVPDFRQIPRERWEEAMRSIPQRLRHRSTHNLGMPFDQLAELGELALSDLPPAPSDLARSQVQAKPQLAPKPAADAFRRANRQVNFRLTEDEYADLATAAKLIGTTPTQLAGMLVRNGVRRVIEEANRPGG